MLNQSYVHKFLSKPVAVGIQNWEAGTLPVVSISCITYNHAAYICDALEGFLMQETTFPVEILIHDDASTDGTVNFIKEYTSKYPNLIFPIYQSENQYSKGIRGIMVKFNFNRSRGKYIALCEGDDYWTDPLKLQKQVDFLEANHEYGLCFHKVKAIVAGELQEEETMEKRYQNIVDKNKITNLDLLKYGNFIHTCSVVFRNNITKIPFEFDYSSVGDYFYFLLVAEKGFLYRMDEYMGVYRRGSGVYSTLSQVDMQRKVVQYHIAILSYLSKDEQKRIFLKSTFDSFANFEKIQLNQAYQKEKMAEYASLKGLIASLFIKIFKIMKKIAWFKGENGY